MSKSRKLRSRKAGLPPGSLVQIGDAKTERPRYTLIEFDEHAFSERALASPADLPPPANPPKTGWLNVHGAPSAADLAGIGKIFGLHPLVQEDILNTAQRQKIDSYDQYLYLVLHRYELNPAPLTLSQDQISLVIGHNNLLSFQERPSQTFEPVRQRLRNGHGPLRKGGVDTLAYSLIDAVVDSYFGVIEQLSEYAEKLEEEILAQPTPSTLEAIHQFKRCISRLRRDLHPLRELLGTLHRDAEAFFHPGIQVYLRDVYDHTVHILESVEDMRDLATGLLDVYLSTVSHRVNLEVRTLTVFTTIFMPATLIAGIFGMNFHIMPWLEDPGGFNYAMGLMAIIATTMIVLFWRRRVFRS